MTSAGRQDGGMPEHRYRPSREDPLLILAMDHRESFGRTLFGVRADHPDAGQRAAMTAAKRLIYAGLARARTQLPCGRAGVLVDERYGQPAIDAARSDGTVPVGGNAAMRRRPGHAVAGCSWFDGAYGQRSSS